MAVEAKHRIDRLKGLPPTPVGYTTSVKLVFAPIGIAAGLLAGLAAQKGFERVWALLDSEDPPEADQRDAPLPKLLAALALEGAIFRIVKGMVDHGARGGFARLTGAWPGDPGDQPR